MEQNVAAEIVMAAGMTIACYTDLRTTKIRNWLTFPMMLLGLIINTVVGGCAGLAMSAIGLVVAFAFYFVMAAMGVLAAGDGKLMMGVGALMGVAFVAEATLASMILFIPVGLGYLIVTGKLGRLAHTAMFLYRKMAMGDKDAIAPEQTYIPHALTLTLGASVAWATDWFNFFP